MLHNTKDKDFEDEMSEAFKVFDRNNDGFVSAEDLRQAMMSIGEKLTNDEVDEMIRAVDRDGDGQISCKRFANEYGILLTINDRHRVCSTDDAEVERCGCECC